MYISCTYCAVQLESNMLKRENGARGIAVPQTGYTIQCVHDMVLCTTPCSFHRNQACGHREAESQEVKKRREKNTRPTKHKRVCFRATIEENPAEPARATARVVCYHAVPVVCRVRGGEVALTLLYRGS